MLKLFSENLNKMHVFPTPRLRGDNFFSDDKRKETFSKKVDKRVLDGSLTTIAD